jgi:hypothetical protein
MIKQIQSSEDIQQAIDLLKQFVKETVYQDLYPQHGNDMHLGRLVHVVMTNHYAWLSYHQQQPVGILLAVKETNMWAPAQKQLRELVWYVLPEYRHTTAAGRLFAEYCRTAQALVASGDIYGYYVSTMPTTGEINLERRGFQPVQQTYLKEH